MLLHMIAMRRGVRSVLDLINGLRNNNLTVHHATLQSYANTNRDLYTPFLNRI